MLLSLFFLNGMFAQEKSIKVFKEQKEKQIIIKECKRIKVKTFDGLKVSGRFKIIDEETILICNTEIKLNQIEKIKRDPMLISICTSTLLFYSSAVISVTGIVYTLTGNTAALLFIIPSSTASAYGVIKPPNILKGYKRTKKWKFIIIESK